MEKRNKKQKLGKVLVINDDIEDILALQARMPESVELFGSSQFEAQCMFNHDYDLIVLDNDANDLKESKGKKTLTHIKEKNPDVRVIYTSFQPGWVPVEVYQTKGVNVVKTDKLPEFFEQSFGIGLRVPEKKESANPQTNIIMTYNPVKGYCPGIYGDGRLVIISHSKRARESGKQVVQKHLEQIYEKFDWKTDKGLIRNVFVYDGINGKDIPGRAAAALGHDLRMRVYLMACSCEWDRKQRFKDKMYVDLRRVECGGTYTLGAIADIILGLKRPGGYGPLPVSLDEILGESEKFA